ncbi:GTPase ObgE [Spirochaeta africana]|uniref:GTPase Obg n=1 Tax=Spirochaeta africana (strain ATCC 700263 / DSM 8902 / Z-7692) TaxID=889378 RepID=H9UK93_SPIAZ|nr:GTPase ObgE [Spirochaeta africana]AFG37936.1 Obg family GTPase CgtA [Spirochaeta africana DSM 8902]
MERFVDQITIDIASGSGGHGAVSFRREKYVPRGGPDGGDGGRGGDVIFRVRENLKTLTHLTMRHAYHAENGHPGSKRNRHGSDGSPAIVEVPPGTVVTNLDTGEVIGDFTEVGEERIVLRGGRGGKGNAHFATSRHQAPRFAQPGEDGERFRVRVELRIIADMGLVGLPNAGKSSLLDVLTNAHPKIGAYPFTTKIPNLGVLQVGYTDIVIADIPGIIEGAAEGHGLGLRFLRHIARTRGLVFLLDVTKPNPGEVFRMLLDELRSYAEELVELPRMVIANKVDLDPDGEYLARFREEIPADETVLALSNFSRQGLEEVIRAIRDIYATEQQAEEQQQRQDDAVPDFMQSPAVDYVPDWAQEEDDAQDA